MPANRQFLIKVSVICHKMKSMSFFAAYQIWKNDYKNQLGKYHMFGGQFFPTIHPLKTQNRLSENKLGAIKRKRVE